MGKYRFIPLQTFSAAMNMALDEAIMEGVKAGTSIPTIRLYMWKPSAVSIGYFQGLDLEVDRKMCDALGVDYVRRQTGGGAVYHDNEITYSLIGPVENYNKNILESYGDICAYVVDALKKIGIDAKFEPINDIMVGTKKISGNAQTRRNGILLQHGTILCGVDVEKMFSLLKVGKEKMSDKLVASVKKYVTSVNDQVDIELQQLVDALQQSFGKDNELIVGEYTQEEMERAKVLAKEKYGSEEWNAMR